MVYSSSMDMSKEFFRVPLLDISTGRFHATLTVVSAFLFLSSPYYLSDTPSLDARALFLCEKFRHYMFLGGRR